MSPGAIWPVFLEQKTVAQQQECHVMVEAETDVLHLHTREPQELLTNC